MINKKAQVTMFVILALLIVAVIALFFVIFRGSEIVGSQDLENPESFLDSCIGKIAREKIDIMLPQGGFVSPIDYKMFNDTKVAYLCKNVNNYEPCIVQFPGLISTIQKELEENLEEDAENCFILLEEELERKNYKYSGGNLRVESILKPGIVEILIHRDFSMTKNSITKDFSSFRTILNNPTYDLAYIANEIVSQESRFCYFENAGFMALYPNYDIRKQVMSDSTKIYIIEDKSTGTKMNIAIRGCVIPAGF